MRILIIKTSSSGDIIQSFPVITLLRRYNPWAKIDWVAERLCCELLLKAHPDLDCVISIDTRGWKRALMRHLPVICNTIRRMRREKYDLVFDLQGNVKSWLVRGFIRAKEKVGYAFSSAPEWPSSLFLSHRYRVDVREAISLQYLSLVQQHLHLPPTPLYERVLLKISPTQANWIAEQVRGITRPTFMVCPGSRWENKKLPLETWVKFLTRLMDRYSPTFFFVWGGSKERGEVEVLHAAFSHSSRVLPKMSFSVWQHFMDRMDSVLTVDSVALHLAATVCTPTFSIFGASKACVYKPLGEIHHAFQGTCPYGTLFDKRCPMLRSCNTGRCLKDIAPDVLEENFVFI